MKYLAPIVSTGVPVTIFYFGLSILGYENIPQLAMHLAILWFVSWILLGIYNHVAFKISLDKATSIMADEYFKNGFPPPKKYGYLEKEDYEEEKWYGQTYLEDITNDSSATEKSRLMAQFYLKDIYQAEKGSSLFLEGRLMKMALVGMNKYQTLLDKIYSRNT